MAFEGSSGPVGATVELLGVDVHHRVAGHAGPAVVLLHHTFGNVATWRHVLAGLSDTARVAAFDRPGFGLTGRPVPRRDARDLYTRAGSVELTVALMDHLGMDRAVLVGSSSGGTIALETVARYPERVQGLVLVAPAITGDVGPPSWLRPALRPLARLLPPLIRRRAGVLTRARIANGWYDPSRATDEDVAAYRSAMETSGWEAALWRAMTAEPSPDVRHVLPRIAVPTLVVTGSHDRTVRPSSSRKVADAIPAGRYVELPRVGHTPQEEAPEALLKVLRNFLDRLP